MKIYTKTGDDGTTGLFGGGRVRKDDARVDAYGTVDELNAVVGTGRASGLGKMSEEVLAQVQVDLFALGGELATVPGKEDKLPMARLGARSLDLPIKQSDNNQHGNSSTTRNRGLERVSFKP